MQTKSSGERNSLYATDTSFAEVWQQLNTLLF